MGKVLDGISADDSVSVSKVLLGKPLEVLVHKLKTRNVQYLSSLRKNFLKIRNYGKLVEVTFAKEIGIQHINQLKNSKSAKGFVERLLE